MRHLAFFQALANSSDDAAQIRAVTGGLVVLRLVDAWLDEGECVATSDAWSLRAAREAVEVMRPDAARDILAGILDTLERAESVDPSLIFPRLMAYGQSLDFDGKWDLAADVFRTVVAHVHPREDADLAVDANMQLAYSTRMLGVYEEAEMAYGQAAEIAHAGGDLVKVLRARVGDAKLALQRGNLPQAEAVLDETIARAADAGLDEVRAIALHDRAMVAHLRGAYEPAIRYAYDALQVLTSGPARDRLLSDMAASFVELGARSIAREALLVLAATAQEQYSRWLATVNLMDIAARDGREIVFEQYRRQLTDTNAPPTMLASFHLEVALGYQRFGHYDQALAAIERALVVSGKHRVNQIYFQAEKARAEIRAQIRPESRPAIEATPAVRDVAEAITAMRVQAGVPA